MALGFQRQGIFGRRNPMDMQPQSQAMPQANAMPIGVEQITKKPGFFGKDSALWKVLGTLGDTFSDGPPIYTESVLQQRDAEERARMAQQRRMQDREDMQWEWQNKPKDVNPYRWKANDGSLMELGPDGQPRQVYKDPNKRLEYRQGPDGRFYPIDTADAPLQPVTDDEWNSASPMGGSGGNVTGGFR